MIESNDLSTLPDFAVRMAREAGANETVPENPNVNPAGN